MAIYLRDATPEKRAEFLAAVREKRRPKTCVVEHIKSLALTFAAVESSRRRISPRSCASQELVSVRRLSAIAKACRCQQELRVFGYDPAS